MYTAVGPKLVRPNTVYNVTIAVEKEAVGPIFFLLTVKTVPEEGPTVYEVREEVPGEVKLIEDESKKEKILFQSEKVEVRPGTSEDL